MEMRQMTCYYRNNTDMLVIASHDLNFFHVCTWASGFGRHTGRYVCSEDGTFGTWHGGGRQFARRGSMYAITRIGRQRGGTERVIGRHGCLTHNNIRITQRNIRTAHVGHGCITRVFSSLKHSKI